MTAGGAAQEHCPLLKTGASSCPLHHLSLEFERLEIESLEIESLEFEIVQGIII